MNSAATTSTRLTSLDQFRGYTMFGMLLVNFLGGYPVCPRIWRHTNDYCSYADTIMPQFLFAAGFAMRLSLGRRREAGGKMPWGRAVRRILGLAIVAIVWYSICDLNGILAKFKVKETGELVQPLGKTLVELFKREYFQTLLHIAATSLWILPVVTSSSKVRVAYAIGSALLHFLLSWWFNFVWAHTDPSGVDGGPLGFLSWAVPALCGTLACDAVRASGPSAALRIAFYGLAVAILGWGFSMGTVLYNVPPDRVLAGNSDAMSSALIPTGSDKAIELESKEKKRNKKLALDPVVPSLERLKSWDGSIVEPPFVPPPDDKHRKWNYWMMCQRSANLSYTTFAAGVSLLLYALFLWACDARGWRLGLFRTLGTNSLAAYIFADIADWVIVPIFPQKGTQVLMALAGSAAWIQTRFGFDFEASFYALRVAETATAFFCFALLVYAACRLLERMGWYIRV